ncbi:hypothetical protein ACFU6M_21210 [Streptomyces bottropensis]|uniref:hypothetical protein n=1 Tax=Streptomyces bottropensis TaxID=42235 RepID=UPI00367F6273
MTTLRTERTPRQLAEELREMEHVDWPSVWAGPPNPGQALDDWCALFGWTPLPQERRLFVRTHSGQQLALNPVAGAVWGPVASLSWTTWNLLADDPGENDKVLADTADVWPGFEEAACSVLGEPEFSGDWDDPAFPEPAHERHWLMPRHVRLQDMSPYRMAMWRQKGPEDRLTVLSVSLGPAPSPKTKRSALLTVKCYPPEAG